MLAPAVEQRDLRAVETRREAICGRESRRSSPENQDLRAGPDLRAWLPCVGKGRKRAGADEGGAPA
jgi:hypothetical protein